MKTAEYKNQALPNVDTKHAGLSIVNESSHARLLQAQAAGPEPIEESHIACCDLKHRQRGQDTTESPSNSPTTSGPSDEKRIGTLNRSHESKSKRPTEISPVAIGDRDAKARVSSQSQRRPLTAMTQESPTPGYAETFERVEEAWHQKAILSLGKYQF